MSELKVLRFGADDPIVREKPITENRQVGVTAE